MAVFVRPKRRRGAVRHNPQFDEEVASSWRDAPLLAMTWIK